MLTVLFLIALHCPSSLLIPLAQQDVASTSNSNKSVVLGPNNSNVAEIIQQIDVKDDENQVISNINHVVVTDENVQHDNNGTQNNGTNNLIINNLLEKTGSVLSTKGVTNPLNSSPLLLSDSLNSNTLKADNITIHGLQNKLANETQINPLNTSNKANVNKIIKKEVDIVQNSNPSNVNVSSTIVPYISGGTTISIDGENVTSLINNLSSGVENEDTGVPTVESSDGENVLHKSLNDAEVELAWRSNIPVGKNKTKKLKQESEVMLDSQTATLLANYANVNNNKNNNNGDLLDSENDEEKSIFVLINSGNIDGLSVNSPINSGNHQMNLENNAIGNLNYSNSKLLNNLINSTINNVLSKILQQNLSNLNSTHIFLLLNSGSISNVHVSSPVLKNFVKNTALKDRSRRHLNESNTNNTKVQSVTLKSSSDTTNPIIDVKFRTDDDEHQDTRKKLKIEHHFTTTASDNKQNNTILGSNVPDNVNLSNSNATTIEIPTEDISKF